MHVRYNGGDVKWINHVIMVWGMHWLWSANMLYDLLDDAPKKDLLAKLVTDSC